MEFSKQMLLSLICLLLSLNLRFVAASSSDSSESGEEANRERRRSYKSSTPSRYNEQQRTNNLHSSRGFSHFSIPLQRSIDILPPLSPTAYFSPFSVFASLKGRQPPSVIPAKLTFHTEIKNGVFTDLSPKRPFSEAPNHGGKKQPHRFTAVSPSKANHPFIAVGQQSLEFTPAVVHHQPVILQGYPVKEIETEVVLQSSCPASSPCIPIVVCAPHYQQVKNENLGCPFHGDTANGACCPPQEKTLRERNLFSPLNIDVPIRDISMSEINYAAKEALWNLQEREHFEEELQVRNIVVDDVSRPSYGHLQFFKTSPRAIGIGRDALIHAFTCNSLVETFNLSPSEASFGLQKFSATGSVIGNTCPAPPRCGKKENFYRTVDGSCNNLYNPKWGQARTPFQRILPPKYSDGHFAPKRSVTGAELPSARVVSLSNIVDADVPDSHFTLSVMQWGQFIDHDLTHTPIFRFGNDSGIECCNKDGKYIDPKLTHPSCFPIEIPIDDPFYSRHGRRCMNFIRSMPAPRDGCNFGFTEQMNQVTHFLDASTIYGSSPEEEEEIKSHRGGLLKLQDKRLLPGDRAAHPGSCNLNQPGQTCFLAGDNRVNEQPDLSVIHTVWVRQHNLLASELSKINPHWTDNTIYEEARRIVIAQMQHIVYNEWLPIIIGTKDVKTNGLLPLREGYFGGYDKHLNPSIFNEFGTIAFRFGHTLVEGMLRLYGKNHKVSETVKLHDHFNGPKLLYQREKFDELLRGLFKQPMQSFDKFISDSLQNRLFQTEKMPFGMDLIALNIQRGRDHAVAGYNDLREACGLPRAKTFKDFGDFLKPDTIATFKRLYASVDDVDPFIGGISEVPVNGGVVGPLFNCILKDQFRILKLGDRFFYENGGMKTSFTEAQLFEIRKISWARLICDNSDHIHKVQPLAMRIPGPLNEKVPCNSPVIPTLDLKPWISAPF